MFLFRKKDAVELQAIQALNENSSKENFLQKHNE